MTATLHNNRPLSNALQITSSETDWTVLVQCLHKSKQKISRSGSDYKNFIFCDMQGTLIAAVTYDRAIARLSRILQPYKKYYISNAGVKNADAEYQLGEYNYSWTLYGRTPVDLFNEPIPASLPCEFNFVKFEDMYRHADSETSIAFRALVVSSSLVQHPTNNSIWDYGVINNEKKIMALRLWGDTLDNEDYSISAGLPQPTIIVGVNVKITTHHGLCITTKKNSFFLHDPPYPEGDPLLAWYTRNAEEIKKLVDEEAYLNINRLLPPPTDEMIVPVRDFEANQAVVKADWISGTIHLLPAQEKLWYCACHNCGKSFEAPVGWNTTCTACDKATQLEARCHIGVFLNDETGTLSATMFSPDAEKLTGFTGAEIKGAADQNAPLNNEIERRINKKPVVCFVKHHEKTFRGITERSCLIVKLYTEEEIAASQAPKTIKGGSSADGVDSSLHVSQLGEEIAPSRAPKTIEGGSSADGVDSSLPVSQLGETENQFFSPNTKLAIEEIADASGLVGASSAAFSCPKRSLLFSNVSTGELDAVLTPPSTMPSPGGNTTATSSGIQQSPGKKVKGKETGKI